MNKCIYCGSFSLDDANGNCSACGAPRERVSGDLSEMIKEVNARAQYFTDLANTTSEALEKRPQFVPYKKLWSNWRKMK